MSTEQWVVIVAGCAECRYGDDDPLIETLGVHPDEETALAAAGGAERVWTPHPSGGFIAHFSDGATWVAPLSALAVVTP